MSRCLCAPTVSTLNEIRTLMFEGDLTVQYVAHVPMYIGRCSGPNIWDTSNRIADWNRQQDSSPQK